MGTGILTATAMGIHTTITATRALSFMWDRGITAVITCGGTGIIGHIRSIGPTTNRGRESPIFQLAGKSWPASRFLQPNRVVQAAVVLSNGLVDICYQMAILRLRERNRISS